MSTKKDYLDENICPGYFQPMSPEQCRAARAWIDWSQDALAKAAGVGLSTVKDFEKAKRVPIPNNLAAIRAALEKEGIVFVDSGDGEPSGLTFSKKR
jgi:DNA-binding transcriptional regulator YiaG